MISNHDLMKDVRVYAVSYVIERDGKVTENTDYSLYLSDMRHCFYSRQKDPRVKSVELKSYDLCAPKTILSCNR